MSRRRVVNGKNTRGGLKRFTISMQNKLVVLFGIVLLAFVGLGVQLFRINRDNGQTYSMQVLSQQAYENQTIPFKRGKILDSKGTVLADSQLVYNVIVDSKQILQKDVYLEPTLDALTDMLIALRGRVRLDETTPPRPDLKRYAIRFRRGVFRPWFSYDFRRFRPDLAPLGEETALPGNVATIDFDGLPPESLLLLETTLTLPAEQDVRLVVSTTANFRAWLDGEEILGQECGPFVPAFHRTPANQLKIGRLAAGPHTLRIGLAPAKEGMRSAPFAFGLADAASNWLPDAVYERENRP